MYASSGRRGVFDSPFVGKIDDSRFDEARVDDAKLNVFGIDTRIHVALLFSFSLFHVTNLSQMREKAS